MHKIAVMILITIGLGMIGSLVLGNIFFAIYFAQLEILVFMAFMYFDLRTNQCNGGETVGLATKGELQEATTN